LRKLLGESFHDVARQKEGRIVEGHLLPDHVHRCIAVPPKPAGAAGIGFLKGKSALALARRVQEEDRNCTGAHFWARGDAVSPVGCELERVKKYSREQETADKEGRF
jgi:REP-associated tyrosine transposase